MGDLWQDVRISLRRLAASPGFTLLVVATFALGIGANAALFSLFDRILLRPLPVRDPGRLVMLHAPGPNRGFITMSKSEPFPMSHPMFEDLRDKADVFDGVLAYYETSVHLTVGDQPELVSAILVTGTYFPTLGVQAARGRLLTPADDVTPGAHPIAVLTYAYWQGHFGGRDDVIGKTVRVNQTPMTIVGVAPERFVGMEADRDPALFVPVAMKAQMTPTWDKLNERRAMWLSVFARLKPGVPVERATASVNGLYHQILQQELSEIPDASERFRTRFLEKKMQLLPGIAGASGFRENAATPLRVLVTTAAVVLLIACLNVANLLFVRATRRHKEIAVRLALGARRTRVVRQLVVEGAVLAVLGAAAGLVGAHLSLPLIIRMLPADELQASLAGGLDARVLWFAAAVTVVCVMVAAVAPAWHATRLSLSPALREGSGATAAGGQRLRHGLIVAQVALSLALVFGAGLLGRTLSRLAATPAGFDVERLVSFSVSPVLSGYGDAQLRVLFDRMLEQIEAIPGIVAVGSSDGPLLAHSVAQMTVTIPGYEPGPDEDMNPMYNAVSNDFVGAIGATVLAGRSFDERDTAGNQRVAMVSESFAKRFFKDGAIGKHVKVNGTSTDLEIVGVFSNFKRGSLREDPNRLAVLVPYSQQPDLDGMTFYARMRGSEGAIAIALRDAVRKVEPSLPLYDVRTVEEQRNRSMFAERTSAWLAGAFAGLAVLLAGLGLYGTLSHGVALRLREIGVRLALGAEPTGIVRLVAGQAVRLVVIGLAIGVPLAAALAMLVRSQLFGVEAYDPVVASTALAALGATAALASYAPAARAAATDPADTLRCE